jgi:hypothetical protein
MNVEIPDEAVEASFTLIRCAQQGGWGGFSGKAQWSLNGIGPVDGMRQAFTTSDHVRTEYQLMLEALHDAIRNFEIAGGYRTSPTYAELLTLYHSQRINLLAKEP